MNSSSSREHRREEYSSNVVRNLLPSRPMSPYSQKSDFDSNLDYILDDLQQSISRPGSSLGQPITNYPSHHREVQFMQPVNMTTELRERSLSPSNSNRVFKTSKYEYSSSAQNSYNDRKGNLNEINKLDTLLSDLEKERTSTLDRTTRTSFNNNIGIDSGLIEPGSKVIRSIATYSENSNGTNRAPVSRELVFESPDSHLGRHKSPAYETRTIESSSSAKRNISYNDDGLYGKPRTIISHESNERTLSPTDIRSINNPIVPSKEVVHVENNNSSVMREVSLPHEFLPKPGTKVTTTVRTYTYEIPDKDNVRSHPENEKNTAIFYKTERRERSGGVYPNTSTPIHHSAQSYPPLAIQETPQSAISTSMYKYESSNKSTSTSGQQIPPGGITLYPSQPTTIYKTEIVNSTNKQYRSPTPNSYTHNHETIPNQGYPTYHRNEPSTIVVNRQTTTTKNVIHPTEREPLLHPFPVDGPVFTEVDGNPPKRVEDLMATFGDTSEIHYTNKRVQIAEKPLTPNNNLSTTTTKVYSSETDDKNKQITPTKNISGPPVYYPPNHELFAAKEESSAAYRAQGGYAKASGKYMYESSSKSKSTSKSGAAVVPLCCPLCCAMPCTIM